MESVFGGFPSFSACICKCKSSIRLFNIITEFLKSTGWIQTHVSHDFYSSMCLKSMHAKYNVRVKIKTWLFLEKIPSMW